MSEEKTTEQETLTASSQKKQEGGCMQFLYNSKEGTVMGRGASSWAKLGFFYLVFYALLAAFFAIMLAVFMQTIDDKRPKFFADSSVMFRDHGSGAGPGVSLNPSPSDKKSTLFWLKKKTSDTPQETQRLIDKLTAIYKEYDDVATGGDGDVIDCPSDNLNEGGEKSCHFPTENLGGCQKTDDEFGYDSNQPCITLQLNRIFGWEPKPYASDAIPEELQTYLQNTGQTYQDNRIYFTCDGEDPVDRENIGRVKVFPQSGIPFKYFPYRNQPQYMSPLVAVKLENPQKNVLISVLCRAYADNVYFNKQDRLGSVRFELFIEE